MTCTYNSELRSLTSLSFHGRTNVGMLVSVVDVVVVDVVVDVDLEDDDGFDFDEDQYHHGRRPRRRGSYD